MTNRAIARLTMLFALLFGVLAMRQAYVQFVAAPHIAANQYNPRHALLAAHRGRILASDGSVLAHTVRGTRAYPMGDAVAQTVGYVSQRYGTSGLEDTYDGALTPNDTSGDVFTQLDDIRHALSGVSRPPSGADVVTTIEPAIQQALYEHLSEHDRAAGVVLDPRSGAVLAMASVPSYDPNSFDTEFTGLQSDPHSPLLNRAIQGLYPPGSTFKMFTAASALDGGTVTMDSTFDDPGYLVVGNATFHNNEDEATGTADLTTAFALSSNVDFAQIALKMGAEEFYRYLSRFGMGDRLDFELPTERDRIPPVAGIVPGELAQMGFGQGALLMTPMQMALVAATIANDGNEPKPYLVRQLIRQGTRQDVASPGILATPVSADVAGEVKKMMVAVVARGTGTAAELPDVTVAGKTGTATNPSGAAHSWFVCFAPAEHPRVVVAVIVENGGYGATVAAPIAADVLRVALRTVKN